MVYRHDAPEQKSLGDNVVPADPFHRVSTLLDAVGEFRDEASSGLDRRKIPFLAAFPAKFQAP